MTIKESVDITVIPNPNKGEFRVELKKEKEIQSIQVFGVEGKDLVFDSEKINPSVSKISLKDSARGVYWIKVTTKDGQQYSSKFVIK
ncbi:MAG: T9SS type A sorting domain-containing protein [Brumimicrobium sp.]|nr:T9SS type A sorting domain-containing protein [Brumimicrobium sp.]